MVCPHLMRVPGVPLKHRKPEHADQVCARCGNEVGWCSHTPTMSPRALDPESTHSCDDQCGCRPGLSVQQQLREGFQVALGLGPDQQAGDGAVIPGGELLADAVL